jgi:hypothetical protein
MNRRRILLVAAALVLLAGTGAAVVVWQTRTTPRHTATPAVNDRRTQEQKAEDTFLGATAAHLCNVQSTVFDNPAALDAAYHATPTYPGLSAAQVKELERRLATDARFAKRLSDQLQATCQRSR